MSTSRFGSSRPRRASGSRRPAQRGQALVLGLALLFAGVLALFFLFSTAQVVSTRERLDNAADAAAWSAALWRARVMNYHAYANRAIVAQEVAIAQSVTLLSWARHFESFSGNAAVLSTPFPPVAAVLSMAADLASTGRGLTEATAAAEIPARERYKQLLTTSQELLHRSVDTFGLGAVANEVARANDTRFFAFALPDGGAFAQMTRVYRGDDRARLKSVVDESLDDFVSGPRGFDMHLWLLPGGCAGNPSLSPDQWVQQLRKRGGTTMAPGFDRWEAADTMSLHDWQRSGWFSSRCTLRERLPLGWGAAEADADAATPDGDPGGRIIANPGDVRVNPAATTLAEAGIDGSGYAGFGGYRGIAEVRELDLPALEDPLFPVSRVAVLARADGSATRTANFLDLGVGRLRLTENFAGGRLWSLAAAEVYFRRPAGAPPRVEYASLYSPYWQVRLAEPTAAQRAAAEQHVR